MTQREVYFWRIFGIPKGQPRVRAFVRGKHAGVYDPGVANDWKSSIALKVGGGRTPLTCPISLDVCFIFPFPKKIAKRAMAEEFILHTSKPDIDNALKAVMDVLTELFIWVDDAQVVKVTAYKRYATGSSAPGAEIRVLAIEEE